MRLRPYKRCDGAKIISWINNEDVFCKWGGDHFGKYPLGADIINKKYFEDNGDCIEEDNFYPWIAFTDQEGVIGHFIMRYTGGDDKILRFGWVIVDDKIRGKGYGKSMLRLGLQYAFNILCVDKVTIGVFENNEIGHNCYKQIGFIDREIVQSQPWNIIEMEITKEKFYEGFNCKAF